MFPFMEKQMTGLTLGFYGINLYIFTMKLEGFSNYEIYPEEGKVWSYKSNRFIGAKHHTGYWVVSLMSDNGYCEMWLLHRLIWTTVNGEIPQNFQINHIDENKNNNTIFNLNLMTPQENTNWGTGNERRGKSKSLSVIAIKDNLPQILFPSLNGADQYGFDHSKISKCCRGLNNTHKGYQWQYVDDYLADWWEQEMERIEF